MKKQSCEGKRLKSLLILQARGNYRNFHDSLDRQAREADMKKKTEKLVKNPGAFRADVGNCARCGRDHQSVLFVPFICPPRWWTHYAECPKTHEPILMRQAESTKKVRVRNPSKKDIEKTQHSMYHWVTGHR